MVNMATEGTGNLTLVKGDDQSPQMQFSPQPRSVCYL